MRGHTARRYSARISEALLSSAAALALLVPAATAQEMVSSPATGKSAAQMAADTRAYWTAERMAAAKPANMPMVNSAMSKKAAGVLTGRPADAFPTVVPGWSPESGKPQPTAKSVMTFRPGTPQYNRIMATAQPQTFGSPPANPVDYANYGKFQRWNWYGNYLLFPTSVIGKMFFSQNGQGFVCSGTVVNRNTFLTAGHCVSTGTGTFSSNILFCPSYFRSTGSGAPHPNTGCWTGVFMNTTTDWHFSSNFDRDYACVVTAVNGTVHNNSMGNVTGWAGITTNWPRTQMVFSNGYPQGSPFPGYHIIFTAAVEWYSVDSGSTADGNVSKYIGNDMTGGSSGGGWWLSISHATPGFEYPDVDGDGVNTDPLPGLGPYVNGLNSHKRCLGACTTPPSAGQGIFWDEMGSPDFTSSGSDPRDVLDVYNGCIANGGG